MAERTTIKVMHLISTLDVGGAEQNLLRLVTAMDRTAFANHVVCMTRPGVIGSRLVQAGVPVDTLAMKKGMPELRALFRLRFMAGLTKPDIIQCWMYHANILGLTLVKPGRTVWNIRCSDMDLSLYGSVYRLTVRAGARLAHVPSVVVANSQAGRDVHAKLGYRPRRWTVIPNGFDTEAFKPDPEAGRMIRAEQKIPEEALVIGLVCRFDPMKDHAAFFRAAEAFLKARPDAHFILAGRGVTQENHLIGKLIPGGPQRGRFHLLGERSDTGRIFASLDIAASSSAWGEGLPNAVGEAMASAVPCVVTDVGDSGILVGDTGIVVPKSDPGALCAAWQRLAEAGPDCRKLMGGNARKRIIEHYSLSSMVREYETLYRSVMTGRGC